MEINHDALNNMIFNLETGYPLSLTDLREVFGTVVDDAILYEVESDNHQAQL